MTTSAAAAPILLVEDDLADVEMTLIAARRAGISRRIEVARDGREALAYLQGDARQEAPHPGLVLLDLNLPGVDGREVLARLKADPLLRRIPVVILTTSEAEDDIARAYDLHANSYLTKPLGMDDFVQMIRALKEFWCDTATPAPHGSA